MTPWKIQADAHAAWRHCAPVLATIVVATVLAGPSCADEALPGANDTPASEPAAASLRRSVRTQPAAANSLDKRTALYTKMLGLDAAQQAKLRQLLVEQREAVRRAWADPKLLPAERVPATRAIEERTGDRIRDLLNDEQKKKYNPPKPPAPPTPDSGAPNVEAWMLRTRQK